MLERVETEHAAAHARTEALRKEQKQLDQEKQRLIKLREDCMKDLDKQDEDLRERQVAKEGEIAEAKKEHGKLDYLLGVSTETE